MTLDGKIATREGKSQWITGAEARARVQGLRQWCDAIMVGGETVRQDDPSLTVREPQGWPRQPQRIVWTRAKSLDPALKVSNGPGAQTILCRASSQSEWKFLAGLGSEQIMALLVEGGGELAAMLLSSRVVDRIAFFIAPKILGGSGSRPVVGGPDPSSLSQALSIVDRRLEEVGEDLLITGKPSYPPDLKRL